ncbi:jg8116 [Pararge aegeria aegeria]|uniref:Jg8116 protein n=1 Tax=Pararge aegeria aegeria TaxID=348720 RepID=A0A8S4SBB4_9NEOP|nr:jg8116 [Pararge aegeria aegeria]
MPSKTRGSKAVKASKENIGILKTTKSKAVSKVLKVTRKPLADKTNSASDDNASLLSDKLKETVASAPIKQINTLCEDNVDRPRRARRLPTRYKENNTLKNLSNSFNASSTNPESPSVTTNAEKNITVSEVNKAAATHNPASKLTVLATKITSPVKKTRKVTLTKSPAKSLVCSLVKTRPKRICRLPTKFDDHSISPNKYVPLQPINASTPLATKTRKANKENGGSSINISPVLTKKVSEQKAVINSQRQKVVADTNNNAKKNKEIVSLSASPGTPGRIFRTKHTDTVTNKNSSIRLLDNNKNQRKRDSSKLDVYEFTFDPDEDPRPAKKKKKKQAPRKPKPKTVTLKSNYDKNLAKALAALKTAVSSKSNTDTTKQNQETTKENVKNLVNHQTNTPSVENNLAIEQSVVKEKNYNSVRLEDIARDFQMNEDDHAIAFDYSPVNSPSRPKSPVDKVKRSMHKVQTPNNADPLNLRDDISFFDDVPVASSSMNVSIRHPQASPWRVEFGNLPIKWQVNTYVKSNMTPAYESSFINFNDSKKRHVYTNMVANDSLPSVDNTSGLKQTSIISFIKEVVERNANKKKKKSTPIKSNSLFEDLTSTSVVDHMTPNKKTPLKSNKNVQITPELGKQHSNNISDASIQKEHLDSENSTENVKEPESLHQNVDKNNTYFGFDDIEDQENVSPIKKNSRARALRSRTRGILQEINEHKGPTRAILPVAVKSKPAQNILNTNEMKSATEPPLLPEVAVDGNNDITMQESCLPENLDDDDQSVHLFEDIDLALIYHPKEKEVEAWAAGFNSMCEDIDEFDLVFE